jgi:hypothetical protein
MHFPKWGQLAQLFNLALDEVDRVVDVGLVVKRPMVKRIELCASSSLRPERAQHVGRLERRRRAGRARRHRDVLDRHDERLAFDEVEARVQVVRTRCSMSPLT